MTFRPYLCGPIMDCTDAEASEWRERCKHIWPDSIDPLRRDYRGCDPARVAGEIVELDKLDIDRCSVVIACCWKPSVGTSMEILYAWERRKPVLVLVGDHIQLSPWIHYHAAAITHTAEELVQIAKRFEEALCK